jgi:hypothetical protein
MKIDLIQVTKNKVETFHVCINEKEIFTSSDYDTANQRYEEQIDRLPKVVTLKSTIIK